MNTLCGRRENFRASLGVQADLACEGGQAVVLAAEACRQGRQYGLILLDWKMPDMDGVQALRLIRGQVRRKVPVAIFSAFDWAYIEPVAVEAVAPPQRFRYSL